MGCFAGHLGFVGYRSGTNRLTHSISLFSFHAQISDAGIVLLMESTPLYLARETNSTVFQQRGLLPLVVLLRLQYAGQRY